MSDLVATQLSEATSARLYAMAEVELNRRLDAYDALAASARKLKDWGEELQRMSKNDTPDTPTTVTATWVAQQIRIAFGGLDV